jgi:hypothetical protein
MKHLTREEASAALSKGQGRIYLHVLHQGVALVQDMLLEACLRNLIYDRQSEESRADWLLSMLDLTGKEAFYQERVLEALSLATEYWDVSQLMDLAVAFARRGCVHARDALYREFDRQRFGEEWLGGQQILELDGVSGMLHLAEVLGARQLANGDYWIDDHFLSEACAQSGTGAIMAALHDRARSSRGVRVYFDRVMATRATRGMTTPTPRAVKDIEAILSDIDGAAGEYPGHYTHFGKRASLQDLERVFERLLVESRPDRLLRCLWVFRRRAVPQLRSRLFALAASADEQLQNAAIAAIAQTQDRSVRALGVELLRENPSTVRRGAIGLFRRNYVPGDYRFIESALFVPEDRDVAHDMGFDILDLADTYPHPELAGCLAWVYEHTPCSNCRGKALAALLARNRAPLPLLREAVWDCSEETRTAAKNALLESDASAEG